MIDYKVIGKNIRKYRQLADKSQAQLAEAIDISVTHMSHIETGSTKLSLPVLVAISENLHVTADDLLRTHDGAISKKEVDDFLYDVDSSAGAIIKETLTSLVDSLKRHM